MRIATGRPVEPINTGNGSNDATWWHLHSHFFYGLDNKKVIFSIFSPKNLKNCITAYGNFEEL